MPHLRKRFAERQVQKLARLWPVVGVLGPRQSGKTTLIRNLLSIDGSQSLDDIEARLEAQSSPKAFLARLSRPAVIDEIQKAPELFDAIKLNVDHKRVPGSYYLTGSTSFSAKLGIRESLTGRIGLITLSPLTLAEIKSKPFRAVRALGEPRFSLQDAVRVMVTGGMPVPAFLRDADQREMYWRSWLDTTLSRDLPRFFKSGYDPDFAYTLLNRMGALFIEGELPTLKHFSAKAQKIRAYFSAMEEIFLLRRIVCHEAGIGKDVWITMDSGLAAHLMGKTIGEGPALTLARHFLWNEWITQKEYQGVRPERVYYKSAAGSPVDAVLDGLPMRVVASAAAAIRRAKWEERPLLGAMKKVGAKFGYLVAPVEKMIPAPKSGGVGILPWSAWS